MERKALFGRGSSLLISSPALVLFGAGVLLALRLGSGGVAGDRGGMDGIRGG